VAQFDAVVSLIAIHWVNDIKATSEAIARSLKPKGLFLALIGLDIEDFYELRFKFINTSKWAQYFKDNERKISPCYYDKNIYLEAF
jgi:SAM-dependent methyltransferase